MSTDGDAVKAKIRKLLNLSKDNAASEGEIDNAMRMAAKLMDEHHLSEAEIEAAKPVEQRVKDEDISMGMSDTPMVGKNFTTWEFTLSGAIEFLVGSVKRYYTTVNKKNSFGVGVDVKVMRFYGPAEDAQLASELMIDWSSIISTMATGKFGGCFRGDGAQYAMGFATRLHQRAKEAHQARKLMITPATCTAMVLSSGGKSLGHVLERKQELAANWLERDQKIKLGSSRGSGGYSGGSQDAFASGMHDGSKAEFSAARKAKLSGKGS